MDVHIHALYLASVILLWFGVYHIAWWLTAIAREPSLVCLSVGPFGISVISLREPPARRLLAQLCVATVALAASVYATLYLVVPPPIGGLERSLPAKVLAVMVPVAVISATRLVGILRDRLYPLWGEARVMTAVQRSLATGGRVYFTPTGRTFLRERFGATPHEFLRMVRY